MDYTSSTDGSLQHHSKKQRPSIPSEVSISGQSDLEASMTSSFDQYRPEDSDLQVDEEIVDQTDADAAPKEENDETNESNDDDEPKWEKLTEYPNTRSEIQSFLSAREQRTVSSDRFASAIDQLHDSVSASIEDLVSSVVELFNTKSDMLDEYERSLNYDYVVNEKRRGEMQTKLEESARAAQGLFANLLMRIAQPADLGVESVLGGGGELSCSNKGGDRKSSPEIGDEEPDWDAITRHEPAKTDVPIYLEARNRREGATARFETAIQDFQQSVEDCLQDLTQAMVDMYNEHSAKLDEYECMLKQEYVHNDEVRSKMKANIEESANAASKMFEQLMDRVMQQETSSGQVVQENQFGAGSLTQATTLNSP